MQKKLLFIGFAILLTSPSQLKAQYFEKDGTYNPGYRITDSDVVSVEMKTWKYGWLLGIPYGKSLEATEFRIPGYIREFGYALAYQKFFWKGLYAGVHLMNAWQTFVDDGFQIFNTYRIGCHINLFNDRYLYSTQLPSLTAFIIRLNRWMTTGLNSSSEDLGYTLVSTFKPAIIK